MTLQYASDLHLEFPENRRFLEQNPLQKTGDILVLAGDVVTFSKIELANSFFDRVSSQFERVYWLPGNHEYYGFDLSSKPTVLHEAIRPNVWLVNQATVIHNKVRLLFSTLWSHIGYTMESIIQRQLNDFYQIRFGDRLFLPSDYNRLHDENLAFLKMELTKPFEGKTIVATHHIPTFYNYPEQYKCDDLNEAFATELFDLISDQGPDAWIFGRHHCNMSAFTVGKTQMLTNQLGYVARGEYVSYNSCNSI